MPDFDLDSALAAGYTHAAPLACPCPGCGGTLAESQVDADTNDYGRFTDEFVIWSECDRCQQLVQNLYVLSEVEYGSGRSQEYDARCGAEWRNSRECPTCGGLTKIEFDVDTEDIKDSEEEGLRYLNVHCIGRPYEGGDDDGDDGRGEWDNGCDHMWMAVYKFLRADLV